MKTKQYILLFTFALLSIFSTGQDIDSQQEKFANSFVSAVASHDSKKVMKHLDKAYLKEQLAFLEGNSEQLVNELLSGEAINDPDRYINTKLDEISYFTIESVIVLKEAGQYNYIFKVRKGEVEFYASLLLVKRGKKYGFIGSVG